MEGKVYLQLTSWTVDISRIDNENRLLGKCDSIGHIEVKGERGK